ncbi:hypothetical protein RRF57_000111 [Xylaria bambusicola]|uniref:Uncharacterized protein n=1 Tax=Xylaria bambusicola TaxID=326684 RepID=A0AAN7YTW1_9PEZI
MHILRHEKERKIEIEIKRERYYMEACSEGLESLKLRSPPKQTTALDDRLMNCCHVKNSPITRESQQQAAAARPDVTPTCLLHTNSILLLLTTTLYYYSHIISQGKRDGQKPSKERDKTHAPMDCECTWSKPTYLTYLPYFTTHHPLLVGLVLPAHTIIALKRVHVAHPPATAIPEPISAPPLAATIRLG